MKYEPGLAGAVKLTFTLNVEPGCASFRGFACTAITSPPFLVMILPSGINASPLFLKVHDFLIAARGATVKELSGFSKTSFT